MSFYVFVFVFFQTDQSGRPSDSTPEGSLSLPKPVNSTSGWKIPKGR